MKTPIDQLVVVTTNGIEGKRCVPLSLVTASCCVSKSLIADTLANVKNWSTGGELQAYTQLLDDATKSVVERVRTQASGLQADAVTCFRLVTTDVAEGAAELIGYGTAVRFVRNCDDACPAIRSPLLTPKSRRGAFADRSKRRIGRTSSGPRPEAVVLGKK